MKYNIKLALRIAAASFEEDTAESRAPIGECPDIIILGSNKNFTLIFDKARALTNILS
jgi:hypothetical protein